MARDYDLRPERRDIMVGFKVSKKEKENLSKFLKENGLNMSRFIRHVVNKAMDGKL